MKAQLVINEPAPLPPMDMASFSPSQPNGNAPHGVAPTKRYNAFGILEDVPPEDIAAAKPNDAPKGREKKDKKRK